MEVITNFLIHEGIEYSAERLKEIRKKKYKSNEYWWVYVGGDDYAEMPLHVYVWNLHNPHARVKPNDGKLIHHKDENKENNAPSNLYACKKEEHDRDHLTKRRKQHPRKFSKKTSSIGGKNAHKNHPELKDNLKNLKKKKVKESVEVVQESIVILGITVASFVYSAVVTIIGITQTIAYMKTLKHDSKVSKKLSKIVNDGKIYVVKRAPSKKELNAFALPDNGEIVYFSAIQKVLSDREFYAILLHEVGHVKQKKQLVRLKTWAGDSVVLAIVWNALFFLIAAGLHAYVAILAVWIFRNLVLNLLPTGISRYFEYDADSYAVKMGYGNELASALKKFAKAYNMNIKPCSTIQCKILRKLEQIYSTHPQIANRIEDLLKQANFYKSMLKRGISGAFAYSASFLDITIGAPAKKLFTLIFRKMK